MSVIVKANNPADLLAMVPSFVGFTPRRSFVLLAFRGKRTCGAMRYDLPTSTAESVLKRVATSVVGTLCKISGADRVVVAIYTDEAIQSGTLPHRDFANVLGRRLEFSGFELLESLCQASDGWGSYCDADTPTTGHPLSDITNSPVVANLPADALPNDAEIPARVPDAPAADKQRVSEALARYRLLAEPVSSDDDDLPAEFEALEDLTLFVEEALEWDESAIRANDALLLFMLKGPPMRDLTMLQWASDLATGDVLMDEAERWKRGNRDITMADVHTSPNVDEARKIDPSYSMAELLDTILSNGMLPEWAFAVPTDPI